MANVGFATLSVIPSFDGFERRLDRGTSGAFNSVGTRSGSRFGGVLGRSTGASFGKTFRSAAKVGIAGALAVTAGAIKLGADALGEAEEAQKVGRQTAAVIRSTGGAARVSKSDVGELATRLSYLAGVDDELVQSSANVLLTFKNIRNVGGKNNKIFDRGAKVALNMSTALGTDLKGASIQVGKALNDPIKGISALARVGVSFTKQQKAQITALVEGGDANAAMALGLIDSTTTYNNLLKEQDGNAQAVFKTLTRDLTPAQVELFNHYSEGNHTLEAQKRILKELGSEFGGSARSQATASDRLKVAFGNVEESLGKGLLPIVQDFSRFLLREGVPAAQEFSDWFTKEGIPAIRDLGRKLRPLASELLPAAADAFKSVRNFAKDALPFAEGIVGAFNDMPGWVKKILVGGVAGGLTAKKLGILGGNGGGLFSKGSTPASPLFVAVVNGGLGPNVPTRNPKTPRGPRGSTATDLALLLGIPLGAGLGANALDKVFGGRQADDKSRSREDRFIDKWGQTTREAIEDAFGGVADKVGEKRGGLLPGGRGFDLPFTNIPGIDFFSNTKGVQEQLDKLTGSQLAELNEQIKQTYGVGLPALAKQGFVSASTIAKLELNKQVAYFQNVKGKANDYSLFVRRSFPSELPTNYTVLGYETTTKKARDYLALLLQIRDVHIDTRLDRSGGSGGAGSGFVPTTTPHQEPSGRGVTITVEKVEAQDVNGLLRDLQGRAHRAGSDGIRR